MITTIQNPVVLAVMGLAIFMIIMVSGSLILQVFNQGSIARSMRNEKLDNTMTNLLIAQMMRGGSNGQAPRANGSNVANNATEFVPFYVDSGSSQAAAEVLGLPQGLQNAQAASARRGITISTGTMLAMVGTIAFLLGALGIMLVAKF